MRRIHTKPSLADWLACPFWIARGLLLAIPVVFQQRDWRGWLLKSTLGMALYAFGSGLLEVIRGTGSGLRKARDTALFVLLFVVVAMITIFRLRIGPPTDGSLEFVE